ncbi:FabD/lysophospholipase-like protein [Linderina pennispora]|uniref:Lysophospholipase n=1 Tax=Linderina pennispora TaxID=61395 RepID=A0A1Y1WDV8_9FUNG|nr:FabD/lysophospholipase-like protein [Linderina pennispora]ORX71416.1 FabD/lysophospholipase-like protein [Linderina pennispora]
MLPPQLQRPWIDSSARLFINKEIYPEIEHTPIIRQGKGICANEERYQKVRAQKMHKDFAEFIGVPASSIDPRDIPVIGVAGSGGGFRAMVSTIGSLRAMHKAGLYQCTMYEAAVSGSSWALAALHTYADGNPHLVLDNLRLAMRENMFSMTSLISVRMVATWRRKAMMTGLIEPCRLCQAPPFSIVELYGALLFKQLIVHHEKHADTETTHLDPHWVKMSAQAKRVESGDQPMPIYTAVRHYVNRSVFADSTSRHEYQWFEFSPFEFGSAEHGLWVPAWGLGRPMADGEELFKLGEMHFGSIMGAVSSAFCASIKAMLMEIYLVAPASLSSVIGQLVNRYDHDTSVSHPIPPYTMFNPFRRDTSRSSDPRRAELQEHSFLSLMDAGMDNNLPFAPLLRPERNVDVIICLDSSANIELMSWFSRAERWAEQNGVTRWPWGARPWKAEPLLSDASSQSSFATYAARDAAQRTEESMPTISVIYLPLLPNSSFTDPEFDPATADFCATFNAQWKPEQVDKLADLTSANFEQELERIRMAVKDAYLKKKAYREYLERYG